MNITPLTIYLWQLADRLGNFFVATALVTAFIAAGSLLFSSCPIDDLAERAKKIIKPATCLSTIFAVLAAFCPSSSTIAMMIVIPEIAHSKVVQQDLPDIYNAAVEALKNQLKK